MTIHGRFEFDTDFSLRTSIAENHSALGDQDDRIGDAYRAGFEDGKHESQSQAYAKGEQLLNKILGKLYDIDHVIQEHDQFVFDSLAHSLNAIILQFVRGTTLPDLLAHDQFGLRSLMNGLMERKNIKIAVSAENHAILNDTSMFASKLHDVLIISDSTLIGNDFEFRYEDGGVIFSTEEILKSIQLTIETLRSNS